MELASKMELGQNELHSSAARSLQQLHGDYQRMLYKIPLNDGWIPRSIHDLAQLGTWGGNPGNINRELKHWLGEPTLQKPMVITVQMITPKPKTGEAMTKDVQFPSL